MTYYSNISKLPMAVYEDCYCDGNLSSLIIGNNEVEDFVLQAAWIDIQEQFSNTIGDMETSVYIKLLKDVNEFVGKLNIAIAIIDLAPTAWVPQFAKPLNKALGTLINFEGLDRKTFLQKIDHCRSRLSGLEMKIDLKKIAIEQHEKKMKAASNGKRPDREYFSSWYNLMEEYFKLPPIDTNVFTALRFCERVRRLNKQLNKKRK